METTKKVATLAATLITIGSLSGVANANDIKQTDHLSTKSELFNSGDWLVGGLFSYDRFGQSNERIDFYALDLEADYFLTNNFSLGFESKVSIADDSENRDVTVGLGVHGRYYFNTNSAFTPYVGIHYSYNHSDSDSKENIPGDGGSDTFGGLGAHIGTLAKIRSNMYFDARLSFTDYNISDSNDKEFINQNTTLSIGVKWKF